MLNRFFFILLVSIFGVINVSAQEQMPDNLAGALCLVRADDQIVLVDEIITGQLSLPGGTIVSGEPAYIAAQRETWEEAKARVSGEGKVFYEPCPYLGGSRS